MKRLLPHLVYWTLIPSLSIFLWQRLEFENQQIALLNQPTDEAHIAVERINSQLVKHIKLSVKEYPSPINFEHERRTQVADSLIIASLSNPLGYDSLPSQLWALTDRTPEVASFFQTILPPKKQPASFPAYQWMITQNDSLRRQLAYLKVLNHCAERLAGYDIRFSSYEPVVSFTTLCPRVGEPLEMDILLSKYSTRTEVTHISVNGQLLPLKEGLAHFQQTFPQPGVYPLQVKANCQYWENDSLSVVEKTFYLHVNR